MTLTLDAGNALTILALLVNFITIVRVAVSVENRFTKLETSLSYVNENLAKYGVIERRTTGE